MSPDLSIRAGSLSARLIDDQLSDIRVGGTPVLDAIYVAVRDAGWGTVPGEIIDHRIERCDEQTLLSFVMHHAAGDVDFRWDGRIVARRNEIRFEMSGVAGADFDACRIGFCLLHPLSLCGHRVVVQTPHGAVEGRFPERISPAQVFEDVTAMSYDIAPDTGISVRLDGDLFETEDHRNWTDAGWKTYCTPLRNGFPSIIHKGHCVIQAVTITAHGSVRAFPAHAGPTELRITTDDIGTLSKIGFGAGSPADARPAATGAIAALKPAHITVEVDLTEQWRSGLEQAAAESVALDTALDVWLTTDGTDLKAAANAVAASRARLGRIAVFDATTHDTVPGLATRLRELLAGRGCSIPVGGGSRAAFAELNRMDLPLTELDFVTYSISPQVHHTDDESIMKTIAAQAHTVRDARRLAAGLPLVIGPITLATRFDPNRRGQPAKTSDPRQLTPFTAAWAAGSVISLSGAADLTYFQTVGPHGLVPRLANGKSPVYDVFRALSRLRGARLSRVEVDRTDLAAIAIRHHNGQVLLVANLSDRSRSILIRDGTRSMDVVLSGYGTALRDLFS